MNGAGSPRNIVARLHPQIVVRGDRFMSMTATATGESTCVCADADGAIRIVESRNDIRAVFTDIQIPGSMDGPKLPRAVRDRWPPVALIVTSGRTDISASDLPSGG